MKIALVGERFDAHGGGAERNLVELASGLARRGHDVTILAGFVKGAERLEGVRILASPVSSTRSGRQLRRFHEWVCERLDSREFDASLSITTAAPATILQPLGGTMRETQRRNVAIRASATARAWKNFCLAFSLKARSMLSLEARVISDPRVKAFAALSRYVSDQLITGYNVDPSRVEIVPNAVEIQPPAQEQRLAWRRAVRGGFGVSDSSVAFVFAAFNPRLKGIDTLLYAMASLKRRGVDAVAMIAGALRYRDQRVAAELGIRDMIRFIGPTQEMPALFAAADATVLPTYYDPASRVIIESLILGIPAISTSFNGASDFITREDGRVCGRVIADPSDAAALADAMAQLCDPAERARCADATKGLADSLSFVHHLDRIEALLIKHAAK